MDEGRSPRTQAIVDLFAAHQELTALEWVELRQSMLDAVVWSLVAIVCTLAAWLGVNAILILLLHDKPIVALGVIVSLNGIVALTSAYQVRRRVTRPFFTQSKREIGHDVRTLLRGLT